MLIWNTYFSVTARYIDFTSVASWEKGTKANNQGQQVLPGH